MYKLYQTATLPSADRSIQEKRIALIDDDPIFRCITSEYLKAQGYLVHEANDGLEGLRVIRDVSPELVICDLSMPVLDGIELVAEISLEYPSLPVIVVSATEEMSDVAQALKFGIKDFLSKPISNFGNLGKAIESTLHDAENYLCDQRDFSSQWFRVESGDMPEDQELHWHLEYLQNNPNAAKDLLHALLPEKDTAQGQWKCAYRMLQSTDTMPLIFDYAWLMNGQFIFYLVDSQNETNNGVAATLLVRALFNDYLRNLKSFNADLKDIAELLENGMSCMASADPVRALFGLADLSEGTLDILPAGLQAQWAGSGKNKHIFAGNLLGSQSLKNAVIKDLPIHESCKLTMSLLGSSSFSLDIYRNKTI